MTLKLYNSNTGWLGWIENGQGTALAFVQLDGKIVWEW